MHVLIPFAFSNSEGCRQALATLQLPHLSQLLRRLAPADTLQGDASSWSPPHERVLARSLGLDDTDGQIPWAAWQAAGQAPAAQPGDAWAWISPASWRVEASHISMGSPDELQLGPQDAATLLDSMRPFFEEDGMALTLLTPTRWLARGEVFRGLASASLDRVAGRDIDSWMPRAAQATPLRRLQNEMQMLLYTHPLNDQRLEQGLAPVNSFWVSGAGALPANWQPSTEPPPAVSRSLAAAALHGDWAAWAQAWATLDATDCRLLLQQLEQGQPAKLTLCGERNARSWHSRPQSWLSRLTGSWRPPTLASQLETL